MASRSDIGVVYLAGLAQGLALVTFPAASAIFLAPTPYGLSKTEYGCMFVPQAITAITARLWGHVGPRGSVRNGSCNWVSWLNLAAMVLLIGSLWVADSLWVSQQQALAYGVLLLATASLGCGFGFSVPTLNTLAAGFFPRQVDRALLALNVLWGWERRSRRYWWRSSYD